MELSCHTLSEICFSFRFLGPFLERAFVSLDFRRKCVKAFPFMKKISDKTAGNWDFRVRGWCCYAVMFISFCLLNKFVFSAGPSSNGIIQMNLARLGDLKVWKNNLNLTLEHQSYIIKRESTTWAKLLSFSSHTYPHPVLWFKCKLRVSLHDCTALHWFLMMKWGYWWTHTRTQPFIDKDS